MRSLGSAFSYSESTCFKDDKYLGSVSSALLVGYGAQAIIILSNYAGDLSISPGS